MPLLHSGMHDERVCDLLQPGQRSIPWHFGVAQFWLMTVNIRAWVRFQVHYFIQLQFTVAYTGCVGPIPDHCVLQSSLHSGVISIRYSLLKTSPFLFVKTCPARYSHVCNSRDSLGFLWSCATFSHGRLFVNLGLDYSLEN
jgi:hypothetical protein